MVSLAPPLASNVIALSALIAEYKPIPPASETKLIEASVDPPLALTPVPWLALIPMVSLVHH